MKLKADAPQQTSTTWKDQLFAAQPGAVKAGQTKTQRGIVLKKIDSAAVDSNGCYSFIS